MRLFITSALIFFSNQIFCQYLTLDELLKFQKSTDEFIETSLSAKNWKLNETKTVSESSKSKELETKQISFAYNRNIYSSKSLIWLTIIRREDEDVDDDNYEPKCRIKYLLSSTISYSKLLKRAAELGFKSFKSWATDENELVKYLGNKKTGLILFIISKKYIDETGKNINAYTINLLTSGDYMFNYSE